MHESLQGKVLIQQTKQILCCIYYRLAANRNLLNLAPQILLLYYSKVVLLGAYKIHHSFFLQFITITILHMYDIMAHCSCWPYAMYSRVALINLVSLPQRDWVVESS